MAQLIAIYLPVILLVAGMLLLLVTGRPLWGGGKLAQKHAVYKSLHSTSPILNGLVALAVIVKPFLESLQKNDWESDLLPSELATPITILFIFSLYAFLGAAIYFFFRAIRNINFFNGSKLRSPYSALIMLVPITNVVVIPYLEYFIYHRSRAFIVPQAASKLRSALLALSAFGLIVTSVAFGLPSEPGATPTYDALSLLVLTASTAGAGGILTTRITTGIARAQDLYARQLGWLPAKEANPKAEQRHRLVEMLKSFGVAICLIAAVITAVSPTLPSRTVQALFELASGH